MMLPNPLHPAIVHFPIALGLGLPLFIAGSLVAIRRGYAARRAWLLPFAIAAALAVVTFVAVQTGEAEEDRVEGVVSESTLEQHEEGAERLRILSAILFLVSAAGLLKSRLGGGARLASLGLAVVLAVLVIQVGSAGGELVYRENAASAYTQDQPSVPPSPDRDD